MFSNRIVPASYPRSLAPDNGPNPMPAAATGDPQPTLFWLAITPQRIEQLVLSLVLVGHSSYRATQEILATVFHYPLSIGSIHNLVRQAAKRAAQINQQQDRRLLPAIAVGAHDEIFQGQRPALVGVDLESSYCYLLAGVSHRDVDSWSVALLELQEAGLSLRYSVADGGHALRKAQQQCWPSVPCHGDVFHALRALNRAGGSLDRRALGSMQAVTELQAKLQRCWKKGQAAHWGRALAAARANERQLVGAADDLRILSQWMREDVLGLRGPDPATRAELFDWIVQEIAKRAAAGGRLVKEAAKLLGGQRDRLLAFAGELERQLRRAMKGMRLTGRSARSWSMSWAVAWRRLGGRWHKPWRPRTAPARWWRTSTAVSAATSFCVGRWATRTSWSCCGSSSTITCWCEAAAGGGGGAARRQCWPAKALRIGLRCWATARHSSTEADPDIRGMRYPRFSNPAGLRSHREM